MTGSAKHQRIVFPGLVTAIGIGWLLTARGIVPGVDWAWIACLGVTGVLILAVRGIDRVTVIVGPFLLLSTLLSFLRQSGRMSIETELPVLVIAIGLLMLGSNLSDLPDPPRRSSGQDDSQ